MSTLCAPINPTLMAVHDLRGPLHAILASLTILRDHLPADAHSPLVDEALGAARHSSQRLLGVVNELLSPETLNESDGAMLRREHINLGELVNETLSDFLPLAMECGVTLVNNCLPNGPEIFADRNKLSRVISNLLDNALKFTPVGGQIEVCCEPPTLDNHTVRLAVQDTGPGFLESERCRLFDGRSRGRRPGTGLGLAWCQWVIQAHGGQLGAEARPGGGSIFYLVLPASD